jgi:shikimate 5-dehydrogenase
MLAHQGALALEIWTGRPAPAALMERVLRAALDA